MDQFQNPYASPASVEGESKSTEWDDAEGGVLFEIASQMDRTRPWMIMLAILLLAIGTIMMLLTIYLLSTVNNEDSSFDVPTRVTRCVISGVFALTLIVGALVLLKAQIEMRNYSRQQSTDRLEQAVAAQNGFWMFAGITMAVIAGLFTIGVVMNLIQ